MDILGIFRVYIVILLCGIFTRVRADFEFCGSGTKYVIKKADCPAGVLFKTPQMISGCYKPGPDDSVSAREHMPNICEDGKEFTGSQIQFADPGDEGEESGTCECGGSATEITLQNTLSNSQANDVAEESVEEKDMELADPSPKLQNQTLRLFMYMTGNLIDENEGGPATISSLVNVLNESINVVTNAVDNRFVSAEFLQDVKRAFLFLLRESINTMIKPIPKTEEREIMNVLSACKQIAAPVTPLYFSGKICSTYSRVNAYAKLKPSGSSNWTAWYRRNEFTVKWMSLDPVAESIWSVFDFVHGYCYSSFASKVNNHHLYQAATERLFNPEMIYRWTNPVRLNQTLYWDNIFSASVRSTLRNLDAANQAAYLQNPFLHRLKRPYLGSSDPPDFIPPPDQAVENSRRRRRRRQANFVNGWCLQDMDAKTDVTEARRKQCTSDV